MHKFNIWSLPTRITLLPASIFNQITNAFILKPEVPVSSASFLHSKYSIIKTVIVKTSSCLFSPIVYIKSCIISRLNTVSLSESEIVNLVFSHILNTSSALISVSFNKLGVHSAIGCTSTLYAFVMNTSTAWLAPLYPRIKVQTFRQFIESLYPTIIASYCTRLFASHRKSNVEDYIMGRLERVFSLIDSTIFQTLRIMDRGVALFRIIAGIKPNAISWTCGSQSSVKETVNFTVNSIKGKVQSSHD